MDNGFGGIYDESFDLNRDGELDAVEFDYMMQELYEDKTESDSDDSYLFEDDEDEQDDWDEDDDDEDDSWEDSEDEDDWDDSDDDDWDDEDFGDYPIKTTILE